MSLQRNDFEQAYRNSERELEELKQRKASEMERIRAAAEETRTRLSPLVDDLPNALTLAASQASDQAAISAEDIKDVKKLKERLGKLVDNALRRQSEKQAAAIETQINAALAAEVQRLAGFNKAIGGLMEKINLNFGGVTVEEGVHGRGEVAAAAIAVLTGLGGLWSGYREAGGKGAAVGAAVSMGTAVAAGIALAVFSAPVTVELGHHSYFHQKYATLTAEEIQKDFDLSDQFIQQNNLNVFPALAYPYGNFPKKGEKKEVFLIYSKKTT